MPVPWVLYAVQSIMSFAIHKTLPGVTIAHHLPYVRGLEAIGCCLLLLLVRLGFAPRLGPAFRTHIGLVIGFAPTGSFVSRSRFSNVGHTVRQIPSSKGKWIAMHISLLSIQGWRSSLQPLGNESQKSQINFASVIQFFTIECLINLSARS